MRKKRKALKEIVRKVPELSKEPDRGFVNIGTPSTWRCKRGDNKQKSGRTCEGKQLL